MKDPKKIDATIQFTGRGKPMAETHGTYTPTMSWPPMIVSQTTTLEDLHLCAALLLAEIRRHEPAFTLEAARESREWFHAEFSDGHRYVLYYNDGKLKYIDGDECAGIIAKIAPMHWPQGAEWVEVK